MGNKTPLLGLILQLDAGLQARVKFVHNKPDHREDRRLLFVGDLHQYTFATARPNLLSSSFPKHATAPLQDAFTGLYARERILYSNFLRDGFG